MAQRGPVQSSSGLGGDTCTASCAQLVNDGAVIPTGLDAGPGGSGWYPFWSRDPANGPGQLGTAPSNAARLDLE